ncbi:hypothetical protein EK21DRAFT_70707 [Setomelanomma holmii]|uniref:Uncharacterized protein n=1 Tax=Setomelanomma holmii TaxID=210430 RepID=A0A9P4H5N7_9PLEO|nr:hypothetical protein EK21DRAFT_70707 [Setomelanomma holmii]
MWKRLQGGRERERHAQIGNPVLLETTYDEDQLRRNPNVADAQNSNHGYNVPAQPYSLSPQYPPNYRVSEVPSATSIYSRPSHDQAYYDNPTASSPSAYEDISPPSSPEPERHLPVTSNQPRRFKSMRDVSPMNENRGKPTNAPRSSNIPVLRKAPAAIHTGESQAPPKFWTAKVEPKSKVRWDEYSGEPTASNAGRTGSVSPNSYARGVANSNKMSMGYHVSVSGPEKKNVSFSERVGRLSTRLPPVETAKYEPWSRATGRSQIARPLKYQPATKPLQIPRKTLSPTPERPSQHAPSSHGSSPTRGNVGADTGFVADDPHNDHMHEDLIKPTPPLKVGRNSPPRGFASPVSPHHPTGLGIQAPFPYPSRSTPTQEQQAQSPDTITHEQAFSKEIPAQQRISTPPQDPIANKSVEQTPEKDKQASTSRFSWTTYNSATTYQHSPPPSPPQSLPTTTPLRPRVVTEPISAASAASSILGRRRPVPQADSIPSRKPLSTDSPGTAKLVSMSSPSPTSASPHSASPTASTYSTSTTKALPLPPTHLSAADHIAVLESAMEDLRIRRSNVYRLLNDLNTAAPPNPLVTDFKRARLVEARKRSFEDELSEIKREEYEVGMKLHRAWKKREREDPNAGSAIWVRRVTS